ncbi:MAG: zinc-dependent metalloprotease [Bacteroidales bacterium]
MLRLKVISLFVLTVITTADYYDLSAQKGSKVSTSQQTEQNVLVRDTTKKVAKEGPQSLEMFIKKDAKIMKGMTSVCIQDGKFYININDSLLNRDILLVTRISKAAAGIRSSFAGYAGDQINSGTYRFEKGINNKIFLTRSISGERSSDTTQAMYSSVQNSNLPSIVASFDIKAQSADKRDNYIDVTDFFNSDAESLFFRKSSKATFKLGAMQKESSYISSLKTYPINTEVKSVKTYIQTDDSGETATYELNNSFVLLPKVPMTPRYADVRVGYFTYSYTDFDQNPQGIKTIRMITRWRLEPKPDDIEKYKRGQLVEPEKPIVFYIDPSTPKEWVPYLIKGVNDWQPLFEKAGFKNAICALEAPSKDKDSTWSLEDARFSAIVYKASDIPNASGPHVIDPRTGEIIESHINWYHNVMSLLRNWYFVQCSPSDTGARKMTFDPKLMGQLIRFASSHEVGHTLGLWHNFGGTAHYTAKQLRDIDFLKENGHTTSIMDYSRFNYVAQPEDRIPRELLFPRLGHYDYWAIEWGYRRFPEIDNPVKEHAKLNQWIIEKTRDKRYSFGTESSASDPRLQSEDLGENQMEANELGIKNLKMVMANLGEWTKEPNTDYENLKIMHNEVNKQYRRYIGHVVKWIGGIYENPKTIEESGDVYTFVEKKRQEEAMNFLKRYLLKEAPVWLIPNEYMKKFADRPEIFLERAYTTVLGSLLSKRVIMNLISAENAFGRDAYAAKDLFYNLEHTIWSGKVVNANERILQKIYVTSLCDLYTGAEAVPKMGMTAEPTSNPKDLTESSSIAYYQIIKALNYLKRIKTNDYNSDAHYTYLIRYIEKTLSSQK